MLRALTICWGLLGVAALLGSAIVRVWGPASALAGHELNAPQIAFGVAWLFFMAFTEGYRGFHKSFSPMVVARAWYLADHPTPLRVLLAPAFCMGFFHGTTRRLVVSWALTAGIVLIVVGVRYLPQPWRGLVDLGVLVGLSLGLASMVWHTVRALRLGGLPEDPQVPATATAAVPCPSTPT